MLHKLMQDSKSDRELSKHKNNYYRDQLKRRSRSHQLNNLPHFNIDNPVHNPVLIHIHKFTGSEGGYYSKDHPLVATAIQLLDHPGTPLEDTALYHFFNTFQPQTYGEKFGVSPSNAIHSLDIKSKFYPWFHIRPTAIPSGMFGPTDISCIQHRLYRISNIINNIKEYGYIPTNNDVIEGYIMINLDGDYRFVISGGHHRVAVLFAMHLRNSCKYNYIPVKLEQKRVPYNVVRLSDIDTWNGNKCCSTESMKEMFLSYFINRHTK